MDEQSQNIPKQNFGFDLSAPDKGIVECKWIVSAQTQQEAVGILNGYLIELKRNFSIAPLPIGDSGDPVVIGGELIRRLVQITEPVAFIVTLHTFVEHWLNQILIKFCPHRKLTRYDFFKKLEIIYCMDKIPQPLFLNLSKLNDLRTTVAHKPDYDLTKMDLNYRGCLPEFELSTFKPSYHPDSKANHIFNVLHIISTVTYSELHNHCIASLGFTRQKKKDD